MLIQHKIKHIDCILRCFDEVILISTILGMDYSVAAILPGFGVHYFVEQVNFLLSIRFVNNNLQIELINLKLKRSLCIVQHDGALSYNAKLTPSF